jgi:hypothetical protein
MKMSNRFKVFAAAFAVLVMASAVFTQELPKIAVYVTGNLGTDEKEALRTRMLVSLINSGRYIAIERSNSFLAEIEKEHIKQRSGEIDDSQISEFGKMFGVNFVCIADITSAFGEFQVSARIVNVETAQVVFIGESASPLKSMADLARVSDQVVKNMFKGQAMPAPQQASDQTPEPAPDAAASKPSSSAQSQYNPAQSQYKNFTNGERWGTVGLNLLAPGVGSIVIMDDWIGAIPQWVLVGGGIALMLSNNVGETTYRTDSYGDRVIDSYDLNGWWWTGFFMVAGDVLYALYRPALYSKKMPTKTASLEPTGFRWAVLPDENGEVKAYLAYRVEF